MLIDKKIAIWGLGLMGGSLALALRNQCEWVLGIDHDPETLRYAEKLGITDYLAAAPDARFQEADVIILALPVNVILSMIPQLAELHPAPALVLDLGSTKQVICATMAALPPQFDAIGGHPMCGKERLGIAEAEIGLYQDAPFALCSTPNTTTRGMKTAAEILKTIGANKIGIDAQTHDDWVAATSHAPYLVSQVLANATPKKALQLAGPGYRSMTRLAHTPPAMMQPILDTNRASVLKALAAIRAELDVVEAGLREGE